MSKIGKRLLGGHWRIGLAGTAALSGAAITFALTESDPTASSTAASQMSAVAKLHASSSEAPPRLPPVLIQAQICLSRCIGGFLTWARRNEAKLPYEFADLMKKPTFRAAFNTLIARWPPEFAGLAQLQDNDRKDLPLEGYTTGLLKTPTGRKIQIYHSVGYPERQWVNAQDLRRAKGSLSIVIDLETGEMAGIFNGPSTLSDYRFEGSSDLLGPLMAFKVASEFHYAKLADLNYPENGPKLAFPLSGDELADADSRLQYLGEHFSDGMITGTRTVSGIKDAQAEAAGQYWYSPNSSFTACIRNSGPTQILEEFSGHTDEPSTNDFRDTNGRLTKVEVINPDRHGNETVWTFYKRRADCEHEKINRSRDLASEYR